MVFYGSPPVGVIITGHQHHDDGWDGVSGSSFSPYRYPVLTEPSYIDMSVAVCSYCGNRYMADRIKSGEVSNCLGCGAFHFHFERMQE